MTNDEVEIANLIGAMGLAGSSLVATYLLSAPDQDEWIFALMCSKSAQAMANRPSPALNLTQPKWGGPDWLHIHILRVEDVLG